MAARPSVTIAILNYQRRETLRQALQRATAETYDLLEVLVVDNASTDGSDTMVEREFPGVQLVRLPENVGCAARNAGVTAAKGDIVITLDNDVLLDTPCAVEVVVAAFANAPRAGAIDFRIVGHDGKLSYRDWCHPRDWHTWGDREFSTDSVLEGASAFRREAFEAAGGYWPALFIGHEGVDLALRILDAGWEIRYTPEIRVVHLVSAEARTSSRIYYTFMRNAIWVALRNHRGPEAVRSIARDLALIAFSSARAGHLRAFVRAIIDAVRGLPAVWRARAPLHPETYARLREIRRQTPGLLAKARRHWRERPI